MSWVNNNNDPREQLRLIIAQAFLDDTGTTWLWDKGELVVDIFCDDPILAIQALAAAAYDKQTREQDDNSF